MSTRRQPDADPTLTMPRPRSDRAVPPSDLSADAARRWSAIVAEFAVVDAAGLELLHAAFRSYDLSQTLAAVIAKDGPTFRDRFAQPRSHPLLPALRDARAAYLHALRSMNFDATPTHPRTGQPPKAIDLAFAQPRGGKR